MNCGKVNEYISEIQIPDKDSCSNSIYSQVKNIKQTTVTKSISHDPVVYFDMDGVLADFNKGVHDMTGFDSPPGRDSSKEDKNRFWSEVNEAGYFYRKLDEIPGTVSVLTETQNKGIKTEILTGIPFPKSVPTAAQDKKEWVTEHISADVVVNTCFAKDKIKKCTGPECILIDDSEKNCNAWKEAGGTAILFDGNIEKLKAELNNALDNINKDKDKDENEI